MIISLLGSRLLHSIVAVSAELTVQDLVLVVTFPLVVVSLKARIVESSHQSLHKEYNPDMVALEPSNVLVVILAVSVELVPDKVQS